METETAVCCCAERGVEAQGCQEHSQEGAGHRGGLGGSSKLQLGPTSCIQCPPCFSAHSLPSCGMGLGAPWAGPRLAASPQLAAGGEGHPAVPLALQQGQRHAAGFQRRECNKEPQKVSE